VETAYPRFTGFCQQVDETTQSEPGAIVLWQQMISPR
jgi:hypothetical protein